MKYLKPRKQCNKRKYTCIPVKFNMLSFALDALFSTKPHDTQLGEAPTPSFLGGDLSAGFPPLFTPHEQPAGFTSCARCAWTALHSIFVQTANPQNCVSDMYS